MTPLTPELENELDEFFTRFAAAGDVGDWDYYNEVFVDTFLNLDPSTVTAVPRAALIAALPAREAMFSAMGIDGLDFTGTSDATQIDEHHVLASTTWNGRPSPGNNHPPLTLQSTFLLRRDPESGWRVAVYLNHQNMTVIANERSTKN